CQHHNTYSWTF
nr:immunoglobulin light chain junction region [Macaca mulatta]